MKRFIAILIAISFLTPNLAQAAAVKIKPSEIKIDISAGVLVEEEIIIENPGVDVFLFEVYLDNFSEWIKINPESFVLESGESQKVILEIKNHETGIYSAMISVVAKPLSERKFRTNAGVKIPLEVRITQGKKLNFSAAIFQSMRDFLSFKNSIFILGIVLISIFAGIFIERKKQPKGTS